MTVQRIDITRILDNISNEVKLSNDTKTNHKVVSKVISFFDKHIIEGIKSDVDMIEIPKLGHLSKSNKGKILKDLKLKDATSIATKGRSLTDDERKDVIDNSKGDIYKRLCNKLNRVEILDNKDTAKNSIRNIIKKVD